MVDSGKLVESGLHITGAIAVLSIFCAFAREVLFRTKSNSPVMALSSSEIQGQLVGVRKSLNRQEKRNRAKKSQEKEEEPLFHSENMDYEKASNILSPHYAGEM